MRTLLPHLEESPDLHEVYARDWLQPGGVRVNFVASVDGAVSIDGLSGGLQTPGDNRVFAVLRDLADVVLVGAGTARAETYRPVTPDGRRRDARERFGLAPELPIALVSSRLDLDLTGPLFHLPEGPGRTIVITHADSPADRRAELSRLVDVIVAGTDAVDLVAARDELSARGLRRVLCEGGPSLFGQAVAAGIVDELCLSVAPRLAGAGPTRIVAGQPWDDVDIPDLTVISLLEEEHAFFYRYRIQR